MYAISSQKILVSTRLNELRARLKKNIEDEIDLDSLEKECSCCYDIKSVEKFICCQSNHFTCEDCVIKHAQNMIYQNATYKVKCINTNQSCNSLYSDSVLKKILNNKIYDEYNKIKIKEEIQYIFSMEGINLIKCQFCETYWDLDPNEKILYCRECKKNTCLNCNELEHKGIPCNKERIKIEETLTKQNFLVCSQCSRCIFKESGCNAVRCPCSNNMCWGCKKQWGQTDAHGCNCSSGVWGNPQNENNIILNNNKYQDYINKLK
jgi:TRIAD3 protein (E3 ubiquitin-protein ligase RNF216)